MYSVNDVRGVIEHDAVVAAHYRDLKVEALEPTTVAKGMAAYVSYRVGDRIYWTRHKVWIKPGETVLSDGDRLIRARCGNCISTTPQRPVAAVEPAHGALDDVVAPVDDSRVDAFAAEAEPEIGSFLSVPFGPQALSMLAPGAAGDVADSPFLWPQLSNPYFVPAGVGGGPGDLPATGGPAPFVPPGGGIGGGGDTLTGSVPAAGTGNPTTGGTTSGETTSGDTSGSAGGGTTEGPGGPTSTTGTPPSTTGTIGVTTGSPGTTTGPGPETTGTTTGRPPTGGTTTTTGASIEPATTGSTGAPTTTSGETTTGRIPGEVTTGSTTTGSLTDTTGIIVTDGSTGGGTGPNPPREAPEPDVLWMVGCGAVAVARRYWPRG